MNGECGPISGTSIYDINNSGDMLTGTNTGLCATGVVTGFNFDTGTYTRSWVCAGDPGGLSPSCSASEMSCGDGAAQSSGDANASVTLISKNTSGEDGDASSPRVSPDGRYVVFYSDSTNLVPGDTN